MSKLTYFFIRSAPRCFKISAELRSLFDHSILICLTLFGTLLTTETNGQSISPKIEMGTSCSVVGHNGAQRHVYVQGLKRWRSASASMNASSSDDLYTIPVVFHLIEQTPTISDIAIKNALTGLNHAFAHTGAFAGDTIGVDTRIRFCLAQNSPDGSVTNGITRMESDYKRFDMDLETAKLKTMSQWDPRHYLNIWVVDKIDAEIIATYTGRTWWQRIGVGGFATLPGGRISLGNLADGVVVAGLSTELLAHECGHYLGLLHTWEGGCKNDDCLADGDMVCDTPPDDEIMDSCNKNSCKTDTLSNYSNNTFFTDVPDMGTNFMDYGNGACTNNFSAGQAERMHFFLETSRQDLYLENGNPDVCSPPCNENIEVSFRKNIDKPLQTDTVVFTVESSGVTDYEWYVEHLGDKSASYSVALPTGYTPSTPIRSTDRNYEHRFFDEGKYRVYLKAWNNTDPTCFTSYSKIVRVICGVDARFWPDKRVIASKIPDALFTDSVRFTNRSTGATDYEWTVTHTNLGPGQTDLPNFTTTDEHLVYLFSQPGIYDITLEATDGTCTDQLGPFTLEVLDPTIDGTPALEVVECHEESADSLVVKLKMFNNGYDTINVGVPVSFYSADPLLSQGAPESVFTYTLDKIVYGFDSADYTISIPGSFTDVDEVYVAFNDPGVDDFPLTFPASDLNVYSFNTVFPPSGYAEIEYDNNTDVIETGFDTLQVNLRNQWACLDDLVELEVEGEWLSVSWNSTQRGNLGVGNPFEYTLQSDDTVRLTAVSMENCRVSNEFLITISEPVADIEPDTSIVFLGSSTTLTATGGVQYSWSPSMDLSNPFSSSTTASPDVTTTYTVEAIDSVGCIATDDAIVFVEEPAYVPNLFTPNSDGRNDFLKVYGLTDVDNFSFRIFNQTGGLVYETTSLNLMSSQGWDGRWRGKDQPIGMYYWQVSGKHTYDKEISLNGEQSGVVHLVR